MTRPTHRIAFALYPSFAALEVFLLRKPLTSGSGKHTSNGSIYKLLTHHRSFITPIFLHAGIIHYALNMVAQLMVSAQLEREMGTGGFFLVYFAAGIFGYVDTS